MKFGSNRTSVAVRLDGGDPALRRPHEADITLWKREDRQHEGGTV